MTSKLHPSFRRAFGTLTVDVQRRARLAYARFKKNPNHPGLQFKPVHAKLKLWSVRVNDSYRAVGVKNSAGDIIWFFIGTHAEYDRLLASR